MGRGILNRENSNHYLNLQKLLEQGLFSLDDLDAFLPGILHINNRQDLSFTYLSPKGCNMIGYTLDQLRKKGSKVLEKHQSAFTREITHLKVMEELNNSNVEKVIVFYQDWKIENDPPFFFLTTTRILNKDQLLSVSLFPSKIKYITPTISRLFGINSTFQKYFDGYNVLTRREKEILFLLGKDFTRKQIASHLFLSEATVKKHCENIYRKLGTHKRTELEKIAVAYIIMEN